MKRYAYYLLIMAAAAMVACQAEPVNNSEINTPEVPELQEGTYTYTINASIPEEESNQEVSALKSNYDAEGKFTWSAGDAISVLFHNGDDNKFFTLTLTSGAGKKAASFSGEITSGYTIGASDGTVGDLKIWALFPASANHTYTVGSTPSFFMAPETDFTAAGAHWSANMPMYDLLTEEGSLSFKNLCSGYLFTFNNIASTINTVKLTVDNNAKTYKVSGSLPLVLEGGEYCIKPDWGSEGVERTLSYIAAVDKVNNKASFYVPTRRNTPYFMPVIDLINYDNGNTIIHLVAPSAQTSPAKGVIKPITVDTDNSTGTPRSLASKFGITWSGVTNSISGNSSAPNGKEDMIRIFKATADASYVYIYFEVNKESLLLNDAYEYANSIDVYMGDAGSSNSTWMWTSNYSIHPFAAWLTKNGLPEVNSWEEVYGGSSKTGGLAEDWGRIFAYEIRLNRSFNAVMQGTSMSIGFLINDQKYHGGPSVDSYMYTPKNGQSMMEITMPTYVAP